MTDYQFKKEDKYLVVKTDDLEAATGETDWQEFWTTVNKVDEYRKAQCKKDNKYVVVNEDEPYAEVVWKLIEMGEKTKHVNR